MSQSVSPSHWQLRTKIRDAYFWITAVTMVRHVIGFGISILLARLLQPSEYGLIGMVLVFSSILASVQELGLGDAVVHFNEDESSLRTYYSVTALAGAVSMGTLMLAAPLVAAFYREPRLTILLRTLSVNLFMAGLQNVSRGRLGKSFRFKELTVRDTIAMVSGGVVGIILAVRGFGVWSLVANLVVFQLLQCLLIIHLVPPRYTLHIQSSVLKRIFSYGLPLTAGGLLFQFYDNADYLVVGKMVGAEALGFYTMAFRLATLAHEKIAAVVNRVAFPSFAAMQNEVDRLVEHWFSISRTISFFNAPLLVYLAVNAPDLVTLGLGKKWLPSVTPLRFLCVVGALRSLVHVIPPILNAVGRTKMVFKFTIANAVLLPASFVIGCKLGGLTGVGVAWCVVYPGLWLFLLFSLQRVVKFSLRAYFLNLRLALVAASLCLMVMLGAGWQAAPGWERLILRSAAGGGTFAACALSQRNIRERVLGMVSRISSRLG